MNELFKLSCLRLLPKKEQLSRAELMKELKLTLSKIDEDLNQMINEIKEKKNGSSKSRA